MRDFIKRINPTVIAAALSAGALVIGMSTGAQADDRWEWRHRHEREYYHHHHREPVYVDRRPVVVDRRPVYVAPPPVVYQPAAPSGLNLNFNIPLQ